jgi:hypothetical protein
MWRENCEWDEPTSSMVGCWQELRTNKYVTVDLDPAQPTITWTADMKWFLEDGQYLAPTDLNGPVYTTPTTVSVNLRFRTQDPRNFVEKSDYISF